MTDTAQPTAHHHPEGLPPGATWDERYAAADQVWSGRPNGALVVEVDGLSPGRVLDVGCGEGADAIWLAQRGWDVTALEVSRVALDRAEVAAQGAGATVRWVHAALLEAEFPRGFDLVSAQYPALHRTPGRGAEQALLDAVAPGGTLLVVHHAVIGPDRSRGPRFDPIDFVSPADVRALLDDGWTVEADERRPREILGGEGAHHAEDVVLRATRRR